MERDPVCGVAIRPGLEAASMTYQGKTFHFCSAECRDIFREKPTFYANKAPAPPEQAKADRT
jgi:Cu+-exporting ATPase